MASRRGMRLRTEAAQRRIDAAVTALAGSHELPAAPERHRDAALNEAQRLEWTADVLEALATGAQPAADAPEGETAGADTLDLSTEREALKTWRMDDLRDAAREAGADPELIGAARSKADLIDLIAGEG